MIDAVDGLLVEDLAHFGLQGACGVQIGAERFLDDDSRPAGLVVVRSEARFIEHVDDEAEHRRRRREIEQAIRSGAELRVVRFELFAQFGIRRFVFERARHVREPFGEVAPERVLGRSGARELVDRFVHLVAKLFAVVFRARKTDDAVIGRQHVAEPEIIHRRHQHSFY